LKNVSVFTHGAGGDDLTVGSRARPGAAKTPKKCKRFHESVFKMVGKGLGPEQRESVFINVKFR
jgi:hypothetical protein